LLDSSLKLLRQGLLDDIIVALAQVVSDLG
jgi:hypothetical protein